MMTTKSDTVIQPDMGWFVACAPFLEPLLADELRALGGRDVRVGHAGVHARGGLTFGYQALLWSRLASRVSLVLYSGKAIDPEELARGLRQITWPEILASGTTFRIRFSGRNEHFRNTQYGAQWVKDVIVDQFRAMALPRPAVSREPDLTIAVNLHRGEAVVSVELNRDSLHKRGYRPVNAAAPLRETLAAAVLIRSGWPDAVQASTQTGERLVLADPMCGSGTLLLEAALMAFDWAPGLLRSPELRAPGFRGHDDALFDQLVKEAWAVHDQAVERRSRLLAFFGNDSDVSAVGSAEAAWEKLGLGGAEWHEEDIRTLPSPPAADRFLVVTNPPYGERLGREPALFGLYGQLGTWLKGVGGSRADAAVLLSADAPVETLGLFYDKAYRVRNGPIECRIFTFPGIKVRQEPDIQPVPDLANRIRKNLRRLKPFLRQDTTDAYRVYDADIPEYALAIDRYDDWLHVQEYAAPQDIPEALAERRVREALLTLPEVLGVHPERIALKQRRRQRGNEQYEKQAEEGVWRTVREHGVRVRVNLTDYLDTGLFLDHRPARHWLQQQAHGKRVLNLFAYTCVASVHAAVGGAHSVDSVDLSKTYLEWGQDNFRLNGLVPEQYGFYRQDVLSWLENSRGTYDLIFLDPPTFSNSKRMKDALDIQRDHGRLIAQAMQRLNPGGTLLFSTNARRFRLDASILSDYTVIDFRQSSLPPDFARNPKIHACWLLQHTPQA